MRPIAACLAALCLLSAALLSPAPVSAQAYSARAYSAQTLSPPTLAPLVRRAAPAVVSIAIQGHVAMQQNPLFNDPLFRQFFNVPQGPIEREFQAAGSGVVIEPREGLIVTNYHVVEHADQIAVTLSDGRKMNARKVGGDESHDLAVIQVPARNLATIPLGNADALQVGDYVIAIGNPFGIGQTVTHGIVSAVRRTDMGGGPQNYIQTDAAINPGNSGGALVNMNGELVGINTAIIGSTGANVGIGFAIPVNVVRRVVGQLMRQTAARSRWG